MPGKQIQCMICLKRMRSDNLGWHSRKCKKQHRRIDNGSSPTWQKRYYELKKGSSVTADHSSSAKMVSRWKREILAIQRMIL